MARKSYQEEPGDDLRQLIWTSGRLSALQLFRIAAWKSAQGLAWLTLNTEEAIAVSTAGAVATIKPWSETNVLQAEVDWDAWQDAVATAIGSDEAGSGLLGLHGVGYPMASAVLSFLAPGAFPVIDRWTVQAVYGTTVARRKGVWQRSHLYAHFTRQLVAEQSLARVAPDIHRVDQLVMNRAMECAHRERPCLCFPQWPIEAPKAKIAF